MFGCAGIDVQNTTIQIEGRIEAKEREGCREARSQTEEVLMGERKVLVERARQEIM